jgi:uncharacterized protein (DUF3084 family)
LGIKKGHPTPVKHNPLNQTKQDNCSEKSLEELIEESHQLGEEALSLFTEAKELQGKADLITDIHLHREVMQEVFKKDKEALELIRKSNELSLEIARKHSEIALGNLRSIRGE